MHSLALLMAGIVEVFGIFLNSKISKLGRTKKFIGFWIVMLNFGISLLFLRYAMKDMHMSVAYAIWTAIGAVGAVFIGAIVDKEKFTLHKSLCLGIIVISVIALKIL
ncbi:MAG: SMR family transporter [Campylobacter sp.]|nr:SMR family transporter [Campylobacter sp.]